MIQPATVQTRFMLRLMLGIIVFCVGMGFLSLILQDILLHRNLFSLEKQIENDANRIRIGKYIIEDLGKAKANFYKTLSVFNPKAQAYLFTELVDITNELALELDVIEKGGDLSKNIPLNLPEKDFLVDTISYQPVGQEKYIEEILVLRVLLSDIKDLIPGLHDLLDQRQLVHKGVLSAENLSAQMNSFFRKSDSQFKRMEEYANKLFYDSTVNMEAVKLEIAEYKRQFTRMTFISSAAVLLVITITGLMVSKRIMNKTVSAIREEENKFRNIADFSYDWDEWILADGSYGYVSPACERISGYSREEFQQNRNLFNDIIHPDDREKVAAHRLDHLNPDAPKAELDFRIIRKDGDICWLWHQCQPLYNNGVWSGRRTTNRDVTLLHNAQENLKVNEQRLTLALEGGELGLWDWDINTGQFLCNTRWFDLLEETQKDMTRSLESWKTRIHPDDFSQVMDNLSKHLQGEHANFNAEYRIQTESKRWIWLFSKGKVIERDKAGKPMRAVVTHSDTSDRKIRENRKRESILQQEKIRSLRSLDTMAGAIAHRFNNSMTAVMGNLELLHDDLPDDSPEKELVVDAREAASGASRIGSIMLTYIGQGMRHNAPESLAELTQKVVTQLKNSFPPFLSVMVVPPTHPLLCNMDQGQLKEVVISVITNAVESMESSGGTLEISFGEDHIARDSFPVIFQEDKQTTGDYVYCQIRDTGCGIKQDDISCIFDPFFTTKFVGRGLGLALAAGIMRSHHGALTVESKPGEGTTVRIILPSISPA